MSSTVQFVHDSESTLKTRLWTGKPLDTAITTFRRTEPCPGTVARSVLPLKSTAVAGTGVQMHGGHAPMRPCGHSRGGKRTVTSEERSVGDRTLRPAMVSTRLVTAPDEVKDRFISAVERVQRCCWCGRCCCDSVADRGAHADASSRRNRNHRSSIRCRLYDTSIYGQLVLVVPILERRELATVATTNDLASRVTQRRGFVRHKVPHSACVPVRVYSDLSPCNTRAAS